MPDTVRDASPLAGVRRIAVLRALHLGDLLCAVPALRALRAAAPGAQITLAGLPWASDFVRRYRAYLDDFIEFPGFAGFVEAEGDVRALRRFARAARDRRFDVAIQLHGSGAQSNRAIRMFGTQQVAGYALNPAEVRGRFLHWREDEPEVARWLRLIEALGAPPQGSHLEWPLETADEQEAEAWLGERGWQRRRFACIHPGSRLPSRRWPVERFAGVAGDLVRRGLRVALTGTAAEAPLAHAVVDHVPPGLRDGMASACGATSIGGLAALVARAALVVSNDTGLSHVAAAVRTPSVVVSSGGDARRWAPADAQRHRVLWHATPCRPCAHAVCPIGHDCARGVSVSTVMNAIASQLGDARHAA